jgi:predicted metal-dependent phosphotriesterase family hydrolase
MLFENATRLRTHDDAWQRCLRQLRIVSDPGVPPVKDVIAPADELMALAHRPPDIPTRFCQGVCNH